ncbi:MAG: prepilin-type N-terminal cleavage/methylation domain-containing protein [Pirellulales bacterium]|nr:prepilin-type N-terminal cleavage/methylation domain-containing protein [Pirellulales bacterium]
MNRSGNFNSITRAKPRAGFTLVELLVVLAIITLISSFMLVAVGELRIMTQHSRTKQQVEKLHTLLMQKWDEVTNRPLPIRMPPNANMVNAGRVRLNAVRELQRIELPERISDIYWVEDPAGFQASDYSRVVRQRDPGTGLQADEYPRAFLSFFYSSAPLVGRSDGLGAGMDLNDPNRAYTSSSTKTYRQKAEDLYRITGKVWTHQFQAAECLYLILSTMRDGDSSALDFLLASEIGDTDEDGMPEIIDGFGRPFEFLRWAPGFSAGRGPDGRWGVASIDDDQNGLVDDGAEANWPGSDDIYSPSEIQSVSATESPDVMDTTMSDPRWNDQNASNDPFTLLPLVFSAGRDGYFGVSVRIAINGNQVFQYYNPNYPNALTGYKNDPHFQLQQNSAIRRFGDVDLVNGAWFDNITSHDLEDDS